MEENKLLNGFNDGLHPSSGIGGNKPYFEETQKEYKETPITDEKELEKYWSIVSDKDPNKPEKYKYTKPKTLKNKVFEALGEVSMCWSETPKGVFESSKAEEIGNRLMKEIEDSGKTYIIDMKLIPENMDIEEFIKTWKQQPIQIVQSKPSLQEAIEVLCNALREDTSEGSLYQDWCYKAAIAFKAEWEKVENNTNIKNASDYKAIISHQAAKNFLNLLISK